MTAQEWLNAVIRRRGADATQADKEVREQAGKLCMEIGELAATARNEMPPLGYETNRAYKGLQQRETWAAGWYAGLLVGDNNPERTMQMLTNIHREAVSRAAICASLAAGGHTAKDRQAAEQTARWHRNRAERIDALCRAHGPDCADDAIIAIRLRGDLCVNCDKLGGIDHIVGLMAGGEHCENNLQPMCPECNSEKELEEAETKRPLHIARQGNNLLTFGSAEEAAEWVASGPNRHLVTEAALRARAEWYGKDYNAIVVDLEAKRAQRELETETPPLLPSDQEESPTESVRQPAYFVIDKAAGRIEVFDSQEEADSFVAADTEWRRPVSEEIILRRKTQEQLDAYVASERAKRKPNQG